MAMNAGHAAVEMCPIESDLGGFVIPDKYARRMRPQIGVVLAVGSGVGVSPGDQVIVHPLDGKRIEGFVCGAYEAENEVRLYGVMCESLGFPLDVPWDESILARLEDGVYQPLGHDVSLRMPDKREERRGVFLPDRLQDREDRATVEAVGDRLERKFTVDGEERTLKPGDVVHFERRALRNIGFDDDEGIAIIHEDGIHLVELN
jgi:co-chaperonin GroES (HSP10)